MGVASRLLSGDAFAHEKITVADTAIGFTAATYGVANKDSTRLTAFVTVEGAYMRYRYDGSNPTTLLGHLSSRGDSFKIEGSQNLKRFRAIAIGDNSASLFVTYERTYG